jgi:hypothetical protein
MAVTELAPSIAFALCGYSALWTYGLDRRLWRRFPWRSLRLQSRQALGMARWRPTGIAERLANSPLQQFALWLATPILAAWVLEFLRVDAPATLRSNDIGVLWQVEGAVLGLAVALGLYGIQTLSRFSLYPEEVARLRLPRTIYVGLALGVLTGLAFLLSPSAGAAPPLEHFRFIGWLGVLSIAAALYWVSLLVRSLPEIVRVADPAFRIGIRLERLRPLSIHAVEDRLIDLVAVAQLTRLGGEFGGKWVPYLLAEGRLGEIRADLGGHVRDADLKRISQTLAIAPGTRFHVRIGSRIFPDQLLADGPVELTKHRRTWLLGLDLQSKPPTEPLANIVSGLRDSALVALQERSVGVDLVLDAYAECLETFARTWHGYAGTMRHADIAEPLSISNTPFGLITKATDDLLMEGLRLESRDGVSALAYFPIRVAQIGLRWEAEAFLGALDSFHAFYWYGTQRAVSSESDQARGAWTYLFSFLDLQVRGLRGNNTIDDDAVARARAYVQRQVIRIGRTMIKNGDLDGYRRLVDATVSTFDD